MVGPPEAKIGVSPIDASPAGALSEFLAHIALSNDAKAAEGCGHIELEVELNRRSGTANAILAHVDGFCR